jgi:WD40 repeat protein
MRLTTPLSHVLTWAVLALVAGPAAAQPKTPPKLDRFGDPLPPGAVARFGNLRWRHDGPLLGARYLPGGDLLTLGNDDTLRLWDGTTGLVKTTHRVDEDIRDMSASPDGRYVLVNAKQGLWLWDRTQTEAPLLWKENEYLKLTDEVKFPLLHYAIAISPDGKSVAAVKGSGVVVWDRATRKVLYGNTGPENPLTVLRPPKTPVAFSPDSRLVVFTRGDQIVVVDCRAGTEVRRFEGHTKEVVRLVFSPDSRLLASAGEDKVLHLWEWASGKARCRLKASGGPCTFSTGSRLLAYEDDKGLIQIWDSSFNRCVRTLPGLLTGAMDLCFSPDDRVLAACGEDSLVFRWDVATGKRLGPEDGHTAEIRGLSASPDQRSLATCGVDGTCRVWDLATGKETACLQGHHWKVHSVAWSPDGTRLASTGRDHTIRLWDVARKQPLAVLKTEDELAFVAFLKGGAKMITLGNEVRVWLTATGKEIPVPKVVGAYHFFPRASIADGTLFAWMIDGGLALWDAVADKQPRTIPLAATPEGLAISPDAKWIAVLHRAVSVIDAANGKVSKELRVKDMSFVGSALTFVKNGKGIMCGSDDGRLVLWSGPDDKEFLAPVNSHAGPVTCLAAVGDGRYFVSGHANGTALLWDVEALAKNQ